MIIALTIITILYLLLIGSFIIGFDKVKIYQIEDTPAKTRFSIAIPFRNEVENLPLLLKSIGALNYPKHLFEILLIDDESTDESVKIIEQFKNDNDSLNISILSNVRVSKSPKKDAITFAINKAQNEWIITTDADCELPKYWLDGFDSFIQKHDTNFIIAPVTYQKIDSFLKRFQLLDFLSLQGATIGGFGIRKPFLCNAANLAYKKSFFKTLNGFEGNSNIASGDDIFILEKAQKVSPESIHYLKSEKVIVTTQSTPNLKALISQRMRWAAKTSQYKNRFGWLTGLIVLLMNVSLIGLLVFVGVDIIPLQFLIYLCVIKFSIDFLILFKTARFFNQEQYLASFIFSSLLYPFFNVYIAFISVFKSYKWKGRAYSK